LIVELFGGCREDAGIEEIILGIPDAMIVQYKEGIPRWKLRK
jgi:hypothetical protein